MKSANKNSGNSGLIPLTVTFQSAKQISGLGMTTLWALAKERRIEVVRVNRRTMITYASLERLLSPETYRESGRMTGRADTAQAT